LYNPYPDTAITPNIFTWTCGAESASPADCSVPGYPYGGLDGTCGSANNGSFSSAPTTNLCSAGIPSPVVDDGVAYTWDCLGENTTETCTATQTTPVSGVCGVAAGGLFAELADIPDGDYCEVGSMV
jgi:hypothetical protein